MIALGWIKLITLNPLLVTLSKSLALILLSPIAKETGTSTLPFIFSKDKNSFFPSSIKIISSYPQALAISATTRP